ncbi:uncharacterized protein LOC100846517 [Brachypodium distachyon]|uniref:DUF761 domain-containing protein n=1 Tax=Brachypodium distachyon TaxID=15368 RepID=A0A0Q3JJM4_BRADI|nr:uncharacterized protein LOC100846517 [Brachypodium distachyon]KQJ98512.1 hypothetical protein BRADI_3g37321v3 [Brachypodium distachyon]|eukprot:XP_003572252.1 uncharacterized protein LOC100846517 [Brachypodium distachyon]
MEPGKRPASLLGTLRTAVKKVRFLLSFSATRWILSSIAGRSHAQSAASPRRLSFSLRQPSLLDAEDRWSPPVAQSGPSRTASLGSTGSVISRTSSAAASVELSRSASATSSRSTGASSPSSSSGDDDIDRRAEQFIANFYKHIQMERQVSLQLRYCRADSMQERTPPSHPG